MKTLLLALIIAPGLGAAASASAQSADGLAPTAAEWRRNCDAYMRAIEGAATSDMEVSWCVGVTSGLLSGLRLGSQLGALNMASRMTVSYQLASKDVFEMFQEQTPESLLQICVPKTIRLRDYIATAHAYVAATAGAAERAMNEVFFESLQAKYACDAPKAAAPPSKPSPVPTPRRRAPARP
jgi:hypothetical protein